jgi:hypothetical protein
MEIITATLTINPVFFQELKDDSYDLRRLLDSVGAILTVPAWRSLLRRGLADLMAQLRDQLSTQFALEEAYGYFEEPRQFDPQFAERAESLRAQHADLFEEISNLAERAEKLARRGLAPGASRQLAARYRQFEEAFEHHEAQENALIQESLFRMRNLQV